MADQLYRLADSWDDEDWPFGMSMDEIDHLNRIAPSKYSYVLWAHDGDYRVELYEYIGEGDVEEVL